MEKMTTREAAEYLGLKPMTLHVYRYKGLGPEWTKTGKHYYYDRAAVVRWNDERARRDTERQNAARDRKAAIKSAKAAATPRARSGKSRKGDARAAA